nr:hypothetical protein [Tanacetum cinerariifolium]
MSTLVFVDPERFTQANGAQSSRVPVPLPEDPYEAIRQAYLVGTDTESEPFKGEARTPESPHIVAPPTCHVEESEGSGTSVARSTSSDSIAPLSPDHPLTHTTPVLVSILRRTARMAVRVPHVMSPSLSGGIAEVAVMSDLAFCKKFRSSYNSSPSPILRVRKMYRGTSELILGTDSEEDDEVKESLDSDSESEDVEDEGPTGEDEDPAAKDEGLVAGIEGLDVDDESYNLDDESRGTAVSEPLGLGYGTLRHRELALEEDHVYSTFEVGQGSGSAPEPERLERVSAFKQPTLTTWTDPEDGAHLELYRGILQDHTQRLDAMPPTLFAEIDRYVRDLYTRSGAVRNEIFSQRYRFRSLEHEQERTAMTSGALLVHDMLLQQTALQRELHEMRDRVTVLEQEKDRTER